MLPTIIWKTLLIFTFLHFTISEYCYYHETTEKTHDYLECQVLNLHQPIKGISLIHLQHNTSIPILKKSLIQPFKNLKTLYMTASNIQQIEPGTFNDTKLELLDLYKNKIKEIGNETLSSLENLKTLDLSYNLLEELQEEVFNGLISLEWMSLNGNLIKQIHKNAFLGLKKLKGLHLRSNKLEILQPETLESLTHLEILDLSFNSLTKLPSSSFQHLPNLQTLELTHNHIEQLPDNLFRNNAKLTNLDLSQNQIENFPKNLFSPLRDLEIFKINSNRISSLNATAFLKSAEKLQEVHLYYNQWSCNELDEMLKKFRENFVVVATSAAITESEIDGIDCRK